MATWRRITIRQYQIIKRMLAAHVTEEMWHPAPPWQNGWRLMFGGEPVAMWKAALTGNELTARVR